MLNFLLSLHHHLKRKSSLKYTPKTEWVTSEQNKIQAMQIRSDEDIEQRGIDPEHILALNFNYTPTFEKLYAPCSEVEIINIHGELKNTANPIVFGYGDELDDDYKEIEKTNDNDFLDNIKSVAYGNTDNYRRLLEFLQISYAAHSMNFEMLE